MYDIHHKIDKDQIQQIRQNRKLIAAPGDVHSANLFQFTINMSLSMCVLLYLSFVCTSAYTNVYSKTITIKQLMKLKLIAGVPKSQAVSVYLITVHHLCAFLM